MNLDLLEQEHLIGRLKLIELLDRLSPYRDLPDRADRRFAQALKGIPSEYQEAALAAFGSVLYLPRQMMDTAWRHLWTDLCVRVDAVPKPSEITLFELDRDQLRDEFYRANALVGRLQDNLPIRSTYDVIDSLMNFERGALSSELSTLLPHMLRRPYWILLVDLSLSGGSAAAEVLRLNRLRKLLIPDYPTRLILLVQILSEPARVALSQAGAEFCHAIAIPSTCALSSPSYNRIADVKLVARMRELCRWFGDSVVLPTDYRIATMSRQSDNPAIAHFGYGCDGWNVVTYKNTPNNSMPILWFRPPGEGYLPPFERIDSRIKDSWRGRQEWLDRIEHDRDVVARLRSALLRGS